MAVPNSVFRAYVEKLGDTERAEFIGNEGDLFYDPEVAAIYLSDGSTAGGVQVGGGGGGSITGVTAGNQLNGGGTVGNVTLNLNSDIAVGVLTATTIGGNLIPGDPSYTLGTLANPWQELFVSNTSIFIGLASIRSTEDNNISLGQTVRIGQAEITSMEGSGAIGFTSVQELDLGDLEFFGLPPTIDFLSSGTIKGQDRNGPGVPLFLLGGISQNGQNGGSIFIRGGEDVGSGDGGSVQIEGGNSASGNEGHVTLQNIYRFEPPSGVSTPQEIKYFFEGTLANGAIDTITVGDQASLGSLKVEFQASRATGTPSGRTLGQTLITHFGTDIQTQLQDAVNSNVSLPTLVNVDGVISTNDLQITVANQVTEEVNYKLFVTAYSIP